MRIFLFLFLLKNAFGGYVGESCPLAPNLFPREYTDDFSLYFFITYYSKLMGTNSIDVINQNGELVECITTSQFLHDYKNINTIAFGAIFYLNEDLYAIGIIGEKTTEISIETNYMWIFTDANLIMRLFNLCYPSNNFKMHLYIEMIWV